MTNKMILFAKLYPALNFNATQAAKQAGYSEKTAKSQGQRLLTNADIQKLIQKNIKKALSNVDEITLRWLKEVQAVAFTDPADFEDDEGNLLPLSEIPKSARAALNGISYVERYNKDGEKTVVKKPMRVDKDKGLKLLGSYLAILNDSPPADETKADKKEKVDTKERIAYLTAKREKNGAK